MKPSLRAVIALTLCVLLGCMGVSISRCAFGETLTSTATTAGVQQAEAELKLPADEQAYYDDLVVLTSGGNRLSGSESARAAAAYIQRRLVSFGLKEIYLLDMPVWQLRNVSSELELDGVRLPLHPMRPNISVLPSTDAEGKGAGHLSEPR